MELRYGGIGDGIRSIIECFAEVAGGCGSCSSWSGAYRRSSSSVSSPGQMVPFLITGPWTPLLLPRAAHGAVSTAKIAANQ
jgi:hypothetical protein